MNSPAGPINNLNKSICCLYIPVSLVDRLVIHTVLLVP